MTQIKIKVIGMACEGCENRIKNALSTIEGIKNVEANYNTGVVIVTAEQTIEKATIEEKINDIGFEVVKED